MYPVFSERHLVIGDSATMNFTWYDDGDYPLVQPTSWYIRAATNSGGAAFFEETIPCIPGDGVTTSYTWTPTTWGYTSGGGYKKTSFFVQALDVNGNSLGSNYAPGGLTHYVMPTISVVASPSTVTSYGETVIFSWVLTGNTDTLDWSENLTLAAGPQGRLWNLYGSTQGEMRSGTVSITQGSSYLGTTSKTYTFDASHGFNSPYNVPNHINSRLNASASVTVDVVIPVYGIGAAKTLYSEGETMYCAVTTTNVATGTTVYWAIEGITGTLFGHDFVGEVNGGFQLDSGGGYTWSVGIDDDAISEPSEMFRLKLYSDASRTNQVAQSSIITILASDQPVYGIGAAKSTYDEGETVYCAVTTTNVATGTTLYWKITGAGVNEQDFIGTLQGTGITNSNGQFTFSRVISNDTTTESTETFKLQLFTDGVGVNLVAESPLYSIIDTSQNITHSITPSSVTVAEGGSITYTVLTTGYPLGTTLYWAMEGVGITSGDFSPQNLTGSGVVANTGIAIGNGAVASPGFSVTKTITADQVTEGSELIYFRLMYPTSGVGDIVATNTQVSILDTSTDPPPAAPTITFTASSTTINSGQAVVLVWNVTNSDDTIINQGIGSVPNSSTETVYPTSTITYTLSATGPGGTNSATVTINVALPVVLNVSGPSQIDWQDSPIPINITASNSPGIILYETYDGVVKPSVSIPNSTGTVSFNPYNYIPDWSNPVSIIQLHFAAGATANHTLVISVGVDRTPDPITIPTTISDPNEDVISPLIAVEVQDIDVPIEIKADQPIQVQVGGNTNWEDVRQG